jgi:hypothetical protein
MELSQGKQRLLFVALVIILAAVGVYLVGPGRSHGAASAGQSPASATGGGSVSSPSAAPLNVPSGAVAPASLPVPTSFKNANIYTWLPFTQQDLDAAANVTVAFMAAYQTYSYTDSVTGYGHRLSSYVTQSLLTSLEQTFQLGLPRWQQGQQSFKSAGVITQISAFGASPQAITFLVTLTQQTTTSGQTTSATHPYTVTTEAVQGGWQVNDIEQADVGNSGQGNQ